MANESLLKNKKIMMPVLIGVLTLCFFWISYQLFFSGTGVPSVGKEPTDSRSEEIKQLTAKLKEDERFNTLEVTQTEGGQWTCTGAINKASDVDALKSKLQELKPGVDWQVDVIPMHPNR